MNLSIVCLVGAVGGALDGVGIFYALREPYKIEIFFVAILKGAIVALMVGFALQNKKVLGGQLEREFCMGFFCPSDFFYRYGALIGILVNRFALPKN